MPTYGLNMGYLLQAKSRKNSPWSRNPLMSKVKKETKPYSFPFKSQLNCFTYCYSSQIVLCDIDNNPKYNIEHFYLTLKGSV